mmetsp:Transcript_39560/g.54931  ORF Transcript_39560/g.54931 Transcript_39560/m.54931 type:complete len:553 (-) Transcript_39560:360-2018(-)
MSHPVEVRGLRARPDLNGKGTITLGEYDERKGRWAVEIPGESAVMGIKPCNLILSNHAIDLIVKQTQRGAAAVVNHICDGHSRCTMVPDGTCVQVLNFEASSHCFSVEVSGKEKAKVLSGCLLQENNELLDEGGVATERMSDPVVVGDHPDWPEHKSLFATRDFKAGEVVFYELPAFVVPSYKKQLVFTLKHLYEKHFKNATESLPELLNLYADEFIAEGTLTSTNWTNPTFSNPLDKNKCMNKKRLLSLLKSAGCEVEESSQEQFWRFARIWSSNCFEVGEDQSALFAILSRVNHSCKPNMLRSETGNGIKCMALVDIARGEELTISYVHDKDLMFPSSLRQNILKRWNFGCKCNRCSADKDDVSGFMCPKASCKGVAFGCRLKSIGPCEVCGAEYDSVKVAELLAAEARTLQEYLKIEADPGIVAFRPSILNQLLTATKKFRGDSTRHWIIAGLNDISADFATQTGAVEESLRKTRDVMAFWDNTVQRLSIRHGWKCEALADQLAVCGKWKEAFETYVNALQELAAIFSANDENVTDVIEKMRKVLQVRI